MSNPARSESAARDSVFRKRHREALTQAGRDATAADEAAASMIAPWCTCGAGEFQPPESHAQTCVGSLRDPADAIRRVLKLMRAAAKGARPNGRAEVHAVAIVGWVAEIESYLTVLEADRTSNAACGPEA